MSVVAKISKNSVVSKEVVNKDVTEAVKEIAVELLKSWNPTSSDFIILRDFYSVSYPAPLAKELLEKVRKYSPKRIEDRVEVTLPIYEIFYEARWAGESLQVDNATVVFPYIDDVTTEEVLKGVLTGLSGVEEEELE
ncbi:conserved hypothetical protein [Pyrobaculum islandicum DSM 4184]|uniref:DUF2286 domain-containing protein n=1 Tax=Pyrobaculum islandicum (strain DSM 4184 / JCM 9189 / GEO3) TaxID=384616 RepID=A1RSR1_PYRIL|nr:DUF2286 domain-containing protein [Pyrobaculum islandicum]ABL87993.1 conserved hypothetical protein [Pyrobaculum islandicum DSM 4184]